MKSKKVIGIDVAYAKPNAWALFIDDRIIKYGTFKSMEQLEKILYLHSPDLLAIEDVYYNKKDSNPGVLKKLAKVIGKIEGVAERMQITHKTIAAISWLTAINAKTRRSADRDHWVKAVARGLICDRPGTYKLNIDEASAINIAAYAARNLMK